ncbi:MAG: energy-coupling factor ABC transporter ATP-binding protein [Verrucomicrobiota bacterium]
MNALEVQQLGYRYPDGTQALREVTFTIGEGERVGLVGPNGAGKSTLFLHLNGLLSEFSAKPTTIRVFGKTVAGDNLAQIRAEVGLLFQDPDDQLFCPTVGEDIAFGPRQLGLSEAEVETRVNQALTQTGLDGYAHRAPHHLSHGEKRRVCLAGLLACQPKILVLDEPTSGLDPRGRRELKALLRALPITQLIATHDLELVVELCPRVIVMERGVIVAEGKTRELLSNEELMLAHGLERPHILQHIHPHHHAS